MSSSVRRAAFCLFVLGQASCVSQALLDSLAPKDEDTVARSYLEAIRTGQWDKAMQATDPALVTSDTRAKLEPMRNVLNHGAPLSSEIVGVHGFANAEQKRFELSYQLHFQDAWVFADVALETTAGKTIIKGARVTPMSDSLERTHAFSLKHKRPLHFIALMLSLAIIALMVYALVACARLKLKRKWLWIVFILLGVIRFNLNWTTGDYDFQFVTVQLFGIGFARASQYSPWILQLSFPLGAIVFLARRKELDRRSQEPPQSTEEREAAERLLKSR